MAKTLYAARRKTPFWFGRDDPVRIDVLGVCFDDVTLEEAAQRGEAMVRDGGFHYAVTPNPEFILEARRYETFRQALLEADLVLR